MLFEDSENYTGKYQYMNMYTSPMKKMNRALKGREHEKNLIRAAMLKPELCNVLLLAEAGTGKALDVNTVIPVADDRGYIRLGDIKVGDYVFDELGKPTEVLGVFPQGALDCYEVTLSDGSSFICNDEHIWQARTRRGHFSNGAYSAHTLRDMIDYDIVRYERLSDGSFSEDYMWYIPAAKAAERTEIDMPSKPYTVGVSIAAQDCVTKGCGRALLGSVRQRADLLCGLMDTSGRAYADGDELVTAFYTSSEELAGYVRTLASSLGYRSELFDGDIDVQGKPISLRIYANPYKAESLFTLGSKISEVTSARNSIDIIRPFYGDVAIESAERTGDRREMLCIYVASKSHCFQIGYEHVVTHNTALVQGLMVEDTDKTYLEVDLPKMLTKLRDTNEMADRLKTLFAEVSQYRTDTGKEVVLFIDEFHQIVQLSSAAVEVLKPMLADSGTRGIRFIAATTQIEYQQWIAPNLPLVERLQRLRLSQPGADVVSDILDSMCKEYDAPPASPTLFEDIYTYTNRYIPSTSQPRKSILVLDTMIGWHRLTGRPLDRKLLADVIYETEGINVAFRVDPTTIKKRLDEKVLAQEVATSYIEQRMQVCVAGLNNPTRPMSSFLFTGSTGVGKGIWDEELIPVYTADGSVVKKRNGDLEIGDYVFGLHGEPVKVVGVYHRGLKDVYRVTLGDGRSMIVDGSHLWTWKYAKAHESETFVTTSTEDIIRRGLYRLERDGRQAARIWIPMNGAMQYPERDYQVHPYVIGALIGNGCLTINALTLSSGNKFVPEKVASLIGSLGTKQNGKNYNWVFIAEKGSNKDGSRDKLIQCDDVLSEVKSLIGVKSHEKRIPDIYKYGSVSQRWELIRGLFDTDGSIGQFDGERFNVSYSTTSEGLANDIREVLFSLGIASSVSNHGDRGRIGDVHDEYDIHVSVANDRKAEFFSLPRKRDIALKALAVKRKRNKMYDIVPIVSIEKLDGQLPTTCIMVDSDEHLYQGPNGCVSHNTETTKQLAEILYDDDRNLIRFDMTEFALPHSLDRFRRELTNRVSAIPYCLILLDEIEKACPEVTRVLLQVLDDGRLLDENEREVTFRNAYIIVTTNAGNEIYKTIAGYESSDVASFKIFEKYDRLIKDSIKGQGGNKFPPELLGRIDCIVPFQPLSRKTMTRIIQMKLQALAKQVKIKHGVELHVHKDIFPYLVFDKLDADSDSGGARIVVSKLEREVTVPLSRYINEHPMEKDIYVSIAGQMAVMNKKQLESEAYVYVGRAFVNRDENAVGAAVV